MTAPLRNGEEKAGFNRIYKFLTMSKSNLTLKKKQGQVVKLLNEITNHSDISIPDVALYLGYSEKQHPSIIKCAEGKQFPEVLNSKIDTLLKKLVLGAKNPDLIRALKQPPIKKEKKEWITLKKSFLVWIPLDLNLPILDYNGIYQPPSVTSIGTQKGLVAYRSKSQYEADGDIFIDKIGMATTIEPGTCVSIQRIDKRLWKPNLYYIMIDTSAQVSIFELLPGDNDKTVKLLSTLRPEGPHRIFPLDSIDAMFCIVDGTYLPKPKRYR